MNIDLDRLGHELTDSRKEVYFDRPTMETPNKKNWENSCQDKDGCMATMMLSANIEFA